MPRSAVSVEEFVGGGAGGGGRPWRGSSDTELATRAIMRQAEEARTDLTRFYSFVMRHELTKERLVAAPHQRLMFSFLEAHQLCVLRMPVGTGKCVTGSTKIACQRTGQLRRIDDVVQDPDATHVQSWSKEKGVHWAALGGKYATGIKQCLGVRLQTGRLVQTTPEHPYLTPEGWKAASELEVGETVATPRVVPPPGDLSRLSNAEVLLLAVLFAEGSTTTDARFSTDDPSLLDLVREAADRMGCDVKFRVDYDYAITRRVGGDKHNPVISLIRDEGLFGCKAKDKRIPPSVFALPTEALARFLSVVWMCDGTVSDNSASITLASEGAIDDLQHLLLRIGVQCSKRYKLARLGDKAFNAWRLNVMACSLEAFASTVTLWGDKAIRLADLRCKKRNPNNGFPVVGPEFQAAFVEEVKAADVTIGDLKAEAGWRSHCSLAGMVFGQGSHGEGRLSLTPQFWMVCDRLGIDRHDWMRSSELYWDEVVDISPIGEQEVYDLTVPGPSCFVANDIVAHNTFGMAATALYLMGNDVTQRAAFISKTQGQAKKPLSMVQDYITEPSLSAGLSLVFPWLIRNTQGKPWTQAELFVERPPGIRDPTLMAAGLDAATPGSRWSFFVADDLIDDENTMTPQARGKVESRFNGRLFSRLDPGTGRGVVTNTPWDRDDLTYYLEKLAGWPTLTMDIYGFIRFTGAKASWMKQALAEHVRPSNTRRGGAFQWYRLRAHDPDPAEQVPLWPARYSAEQIQRLRYGEEGRGGMLPREFARLFLCQPLDPDTARCQHDWVEKCKQRGLGTRMLEEYSGPNKTYTGLDVGIGPGKQHDRTVFFTAELLEDGSRRILDIESGRWPGYVIVSKLLSKADKYGSKLRVENVGAQEFIRQFAGRDRKDLLIDAHTTNKANKWDLDYGVESVFSELQNGAWIIPCDDDGTCHPEVQRWVDDMLYYQPPPAHTGNHLIASWICREAARKGGRGGRRPTVGRKRDFVKMGGAY